MSSTNKGSGIYNSIKGCCINGKKKIWKSLLDKKHLLGKPVHFSIKNIANNADTWYSFSNSFSTCIGLQIQMDTIVV